MVWQPECDFEPQRFDIIIDGIDPARLNVEDGTFESINRKAGVR
jgi:hypothetical protein